MNDDLCWWCGSPLEEENETLRIEVQRLTDLCNAKQDRINKFLKAMEALKQ